MSTGKVHGGRMTKNVTVRSNDPVRPEVMLTVEATIKTSVSLEPPSLSLNDVSRHESRVFTVEVKPFDPQGFDVLGVTLDKSVPTTMQGGAARSVEEKPKLDVSYRKEVPAPAADGTKLVPRWLVEIKLRPDTPPGWLREFVTIRTNDKRTPELKLQVSGAIKGDIECPTNLLLTGRSLSAPLKKDFLVTRAYGAPFRIVSVKPDGAIGSNLSAEVITITEGEQYRVWLSLSPTTPAGQYSGLVTITTDRADQPELKVRVRISIQ